MAPTSQQQREFHLVLLGATGFTGKLVARYLSSHPTSPRWAIAGRNPSRLSSLRASLKLPASVGTVHADLTDEASLREMCRRAACIVSTAGPFRKLGAERVVRICAEEGTAWTDLSGETAFNESVQKCVVVPLSPPPPSPLLLDCVADEHLSLLGPGTTPWRVKQAPSSCLRRASTVCPLIWVPILQRNS
jgi:hypothetical protein